MDSTYTYVNFVLAFTTSIHWQCPLTLTISQHLLPFTSTLPSGSSQQRTHGPCSCSTPLHPPTTSISPSCHFHIHHTNNISLPPTCYKPILSHFNMYVAPLHACYGQTHQPSPLTPANPQFLSVPHLGFNKNDINALTTCHDQSQDYHNPLSLLLQFLLMSLFTPLLIPQQHPLSF